MTDDDHDSGLSGSARRLAHNAVAAAQNRIELFALELREEKNQAVGVLIWVCAAVLCGLMALVAITATAILFCPPGARPWVAAGFVALYVAGAVFAVFKARRRFEDETPPFSATVEEFRKDQEWLQRR